MELPVLIEPLPNQQGYAAQLGPPFHLRAEGPTAEEARQELAALLQQHLSGGAQLGVISVPVAPAGWLPDDELTREWLEQVRQFRQQCDEADRQRLLSTSDESA
jgi:hypothetical protein